MHHNVDDLTLIEGGREHVFSATAARTAEGIMFIPSNAPGIGVPWAQMLAVIPYDNETLTIIASVCLITLYGSEVGTLARIILDRRISDLREGAEINGVKIERITIEHKVVGLGMLL
jgi:hypothetical protein